MRVRVNQQLIYHACGWDRFHATQNNDIANGTLVKVVNLPGCPKANTMGHCYVEHGDNVVLVSTSSLCTKADYADYLRRKIAEHEAKAVSA